MDLSELTISEEEECNLVELAYQYVTIGKYLDSCIASWEKG